MNTPKYKNDNMRFVQLRISPRTHERLKKAAADDERSVTNYTNRLIERHLDVRQVKT